MEGLPHQFAVTHRVGRPVLKASPSFWQRWVQWVAATPLGARAFSLLLPPLDRVLMRVSKGRLSVPSLFAGVPGVVLTSTGAKSGQPRITPLNGIPDGDDVILVASNWGQKHHPAWYHNLRKNPRATLEFQGYRGTYEAVEIVDRDEWERLFARAVSMYAGYADYRRRVGDRPIPLMRLSPA